MDARVPRARHGDYRDRHRTIASLLNATLEQGYWINPVDVHRRRQGATCISIIQGAIIPLWQTTFINR